MWWTNFCCKCNWWTVPIVNSAPSSGCWVGFPPIAATASGNQSGVALPPASPLSRVCPRRWGGSPSGDLSAPPALSLRGWELEVLIRPPSAGRTREGDFPPLVTPVADEGGFTNVSLVTSSTLSKPSDFRSKDVARGFTGNPLTPDRGLSSILQLIRNRLGCSVPQCYSPKMSNWGTLYCYQQPHDGSRLIVHFIRALNFNTVARFFSNSLSAIEILLYA